MARKKRSGPSNGVAVKNISKRPVNTSFGKIEPDAAGLATEQECRSYGKYIRRCDDGRADKKSASVSTTRGKDIPRKDTTNGEDNSGEKSEFKKESGGTKRPFVRKKTS